MLQSAAKRFLNVNVLTIRTASVEEPTTSALPGIATASKDFLPVDSGRLSRKAE